MLFFVEFAPLILFLVGYFYKGIYFAIIALMVSMPISLAAKYKLTGKLDKMLMWSTLFLFLFGGASLYLRDPKFLYWKPTALYWAMAAAFLASQWIGEKPLVQRFFGLIGDLPIDQIPQQQIRRLNLIWVLFFVVVGLLNIAVAYTFSEQIWVNFKVFGLTAITMVFMFAQIYWIFTKTSTETETGD